MKEEVLTMEEEFLLDGKLSSAKNNLTAGIIIALVLFVVILIVPQKYVPVRGSDFSDRSIFESGGFFAIAVMLVMGTIFLFAFLADSRYLSVKKDIYERAKVSGQGRISSIKRAAINEQQEQKRTVFVMDIADKKYQKLYWLEGNLYQFKEGDTVSFECGKHSQILFSITKI
jgi:hypothetical protein